MPANQMREQRCLGSGRLEGIKYSCGAGVQGEEGLVLSPAPSSLDIGLEVRRLLGNLASLQRQEGEKAQLSRSQRGPSWWAGQRGRLCILRTPLTFPPHDRDGLPEPGCILLL